MELLRHCVLAFRLQQLLSFISSVREGCALEPLLGSSATCLELDALQNEPSPPSERARLATATCQLSCRPEVARTAIQAVEVATELRLQGESLDSLVSQ